MRRASWMAGCAVLALATSAWAENTTYTYDGLGRVASVTYVDAGVTYNITYSYDAAGNRTQVVNGGATNTAPVAVDDSFSTPQNTPYTFDPRTNDTDANGDALVISAKTDGSHGTVTNNSGTGVTYTPNTGYAGTDGFSYTVSDGRGGYDTATVSVTVTGVNHAPDAVNDTTTTAYNTAKTYNPRTNDTDPDGNTLTIVSATNGTNGTVVVSGGTDVIYTPASGFSGTDTFNYTVSDGSLTDTATITITVSPANTPPVAVNDSATAIATYTGGAGVRPTKTLDPRTNDSDANGDTLTITGVTQGAKGTVTFTGTTVTYTYGTSINYAFTDTDSFTYTISDGNGGTATATVNMTIVVQTLD